MTFLFSPALPAPFYDYLCSLLQKTLALALCCSCYYYMWLLAETLTFSEELFFTRFTAHRFVEVLGARVRQFSSLLLPSIGNSRFHVTILEFHRPKSPQLAQYHMMQKPKCLQSGILLALKIAAVGLARIRQSCLCFQLLRVSVYRKPLEEKQGTACAKFI